MSILIFYRRRASSLHAARASVGALYGVALAAATLIVQHPAVLAGLAIGVLGAGYACGAIRQMARTMRTLALPILVLSVLVNVLVSRGGLTVFARLGYFAPLGQVNLTVEAAAYGLLVGVRLLIVALAAVLVSSAVDPDELLRTSRRLYPGSALAATLATRLVPVLARDAERLAEAQRCRPDGPPSGARARLGILRARWTARSTSPPRWRCAATAPVGDRSALPVPPPATTSTSHWPRSPCSRPPSPRERAAWRALTSIRCCTPRSAPAPC
jgi:energy-coupling factor transport system permease protein